MALTLKRPIVFFDLETTGLNIAKDRIVEISLLKVFPDHRRESKTIRINPEMHIPEESSAVHHITDADVANCPTFKQVAHEISNMLQGSDIGGYNSNRFDIPLLAEEFERAGVDIDLKRCHSVDVQTIYHKLEQRNLAAAYRFYCGKELVGAHGACADIEATYEVFKAQLERYEDQLPDNIEALAHFTSFNRYVDYAGFIVLNDKDVPCFSFGKYKGRPVADVFKEVPGYLGWILNADFPLYTKRKLQEIRLNSAVKK